MSTQTFTPFVIGQRRYSYNDSPVMTDDQIRRAAPSVFALEPWHKMSSKYAFIPTSEIVTKMRAEGFQVVKAMQARTRIEGKGEFTKHLLRFRDMRNTDAAVQTLGTLYPELVLTNSHDGASAYKLDGGLYRLVCLNGMVVGDSVIPGIHVRHSGDADGIINASYEIVDQFPRALESVEQFAALRLNAGEQNAFATAALSLRYDENESPVTAAQMVAPRRSADREPTLWNTLNVVQERMIGGGTPGTNPTTHRRAKTRAVNGISENVKLNKALWTLAEEMKKLRG